ncbi:hypothetical protein D3C86_830420 [compost metagenome]
MASTAAPIQSSDLVEAVGREAAAGIVRAASTQVQTPKPARRTNAARQPRSPISTPPSEGPNAVPMADTVPNRPIADPIRSLGTTSRAIESGKAKRIAPPTP